MPGRDFTGRLTPPPWPLPDYSDTGLLPDGRFVLKDDKLLVAGRRGVWRFVSAYANRKEEGFWVIQEGSHAIPVTADEVTPTRRSK